MNTIYKYLQNFKIKDQILFVFLAMLLVYISFSLFGISSVIKVSDSSRNSQIQMDSSARILIIEKIISDIQKEALAYSLSGSSGSLKKIKNNYQFIKDELDLAKGAEVKREKLHIINQMINVVDHYGENIESLKKRYEILQNSLRKELPELTGLGLWELEGISLALKGNTKKITLVQDIEGKWLLLALKSRDFISQRKYSIKKEIKSIYEELKNVSMKNKELFGFKKILNDYMNEFNKAVQANRLYLSLINVVMAGDALEFSTLAERLGDITLDELRDSATQTEQILDDSFWVSILTLSISIPLVLLFVFIFNQNISKSITEISQVFIDFINGNLDVSIPGLDRKDEIGLLATAADAFRKQGHELVKAKEEADKSRNIKSDFLANMSHEIRTPMNGVLGMVSMLEETKLTKEQKEMLKTISSSGDSLLTILNDILDFSKLESGRFELENVPFELLLCLSEVEFLFTKAAQEKGIDLYFVIDGDEAPKFIYGDVTRLKQVLINLCSNAIKFTSTGEVFMKVEVIRDENTPRLKFSVHDTGIGIPKDSLSTLFDAFTQADTSITRKFGGTGLGLTISSKLVGLMGGTLKVESVHGEGTVFFFDLELKVANENESGVEKALDEVVNLESNYKILVAEDNEVNLKVLTKMLGKLNLSYTHAWNGKEAVEMARREDFDIILMDMQMPIMDGIEATRQIRTFNKEVYILALTANVLNEDKEKCLAVGMNSFFTKPVRFKDLKHFFTSFKV